MSKVLQCDRCKITGAIGSKAFKLITIGLNNIHLCPHCMKKFEDFLSDPNCMENVDEEDSYSERSISLDDEESGLSVEVHTTAAGVTVPDSQPFVDKVADAVSDNPDDPCPCYAKHCSSPESCCGCKEYDEWKERQKK